MTQISSLSPTIKNKRQAEPVVYVANDSSPDRGIPGSAGAILFPRGILQSDTNLCAWIERIGTGNSRSVQTYLPDRAGSRESARPVMRLEPLGFKPRGPAPLYFSSTVK